MLGTNIGTTLLHLAISGHSCGYILILIDMQHWYNADTMLLGRADFVPELLVNIVKYLEVTPYLVDYNNHVT